MTRETYEALAAAHPGARIYGCNACDRAVIVQPGQMEPGELADWQDCGDDGALCPDCKQPEYEGD